MCSVFAQGFLYFYEKQDKKRILKNKSNPAFSIESRLHVCAARKRDVEALFQNDPAAKKNPDSQRKNGAKGPLGGRISVRMLSVLLKGQRASWGRACFRTVKSSHFYPIERGFIRFAHPTD